jgi:precorrin-2/cobalt-factor-2 C20-methyltransferase
MIMRGIAYGVGVGPGDPELMTLKAVRLIRENDVIAVPGKTPQASVAYRIAAAAVPELRDKTLLCVDMPMTRDRTALERAHRDGAERLERMLEQGKNVVYLTLGDPTVYCSFGYLQRILEADGYFVELVPAVTSFCAAAARLNLPLTVGDEPLHVLPAVHVTDKALCQSGTCVLMKSGGRMAEIKNALRRSGRDVSAVENCGMDTERVFRSVEEIPDETGYFSLIIAREHHSESGHNRSTDE